MALGWEPFIDRLMRADKCEVYLTGSSATMLSKEIAREATVELGQKIGTIVTQNEEERIETGAGTTDVVPAWRFLLSLPESTE